MAKIDALFRMMREQGASDLHLSTGNPPIFRLHGEMERLNFKPLTHDELKAILFEILDDKQKAQFEEKKDLDFAYDSSLCADDDSAAILHDRPLVRRVEQPREGLLLRGGVAVAERLDLRGIAVVEQ